MGAPSFDAAARAPLPTLLGNAVARRRSGWISPPPPREPRTKAEDEEAGARLNALGCAVKHEAAEGVAIFERALLRGCGRTHVYSSGRRGEARRRSVLLPTPQQLPQLAFWNPLPPQRNY